MPWVDRGRSKVFFGRFAVPLTAAQPELPAYPIRAAIARLRCVMQPVRPAAVLAPRPFVFGVDVGLGERVVDKHQGWDYGDDRCKSHGFFLLTHGLVER